MPASAHPAAHQVGELLRAARDLAALYRRAAGRATDARLQAVFRHYARGRARLAAELARAAVETRAPDAPTRWARVNYVGLLARAQPDPDAAWVAQLEEAEDALLDAVEDALDAGIPAAVRAALELRLAEIRSGHDRMRDLKREGLGRVAFTPDGTGDPSSG